MCVAAKRRSNIIREPIDNLRAPAAILSWGQDVLTYGSVEQDKFSANGKGSPHLCSLNAVSTGKRTQLTSSSIVIDRDYRIFQAWNCLDKTNLYQRLATD
jgi:hypothetical protein